MQPYIAFYCFYEDLQVDKIVIIIGGLAKVRLELNSILL